MFIQADDEFGHVFYRVLVFQHELRTFPEDHPRLEETRKAVFDRLQRLTAEKGSVVLRVEHGHLVTDDGPLRTRADLVAEMVTIFQDRRLQAIKIEPTLTLEGVRRLIGLWVPRGEPECLPGPVCIGGITILPHADVAESDATCLALPALPGGPVAASMSSPTIVARSAEELEALFPSAAAPGPVEDPDGEAPTAPETPPGAESSSHDPVEPEPGGTPSAPETTPVENVVADGMVPAAVRPNPVSFEPIPTGTADLSASAVHLNPGAVPARAATPVATEVERLLPMRFWDDAWDRFAPDELQLLGAVLRNPQVVKSLDRLCAELPSPDLEFPFLPQFFALIRRERPGDWTEADVLARTVPRQVDEFLKSVVLSRSAGGVSFSSVAAGRDRVSSNLRWQLLSQLVPEGSDPVDPKRGTDLSSRLRRPILANSASTQLRPSHWDDDLRSGEVLEQFARTCGQLASLCPTDASAIQGVLLQRVGPRLDPGDPVGAMRTMLNTIRALPKSVGTEWLSQAVRDLIPPHRLLPTIQELEATLGRDGGKIPSHQWPIDDHTIAPGLLLKLLEARDLYALDLAFQGVLRAEREHEQRWLNAFRRMLSSQHASEWLGKTSRRFFAGRGLRALFELPPEVIAQEMKRNFKTVAHKVPDVLKAMSGLSRVETSVVMGYVLDKNDVTLTQPTLRFLGENPFPELIPHLKRFLNMANENPEADDLAALACGALGAMIDQPAWDFLEKVRTEKNMLGYRWRKPLRQAATEARKMTPR
ncbi:MAG: hypothetical protein AAF488_04785 [Planctomycetota bacterium]